MNSIAWIDIWHIIIFTNTILALWTVFHRKRSVATSWAWLIVLIIFPVIGFIIYGFVGRGISQENLFAINRQHHIGLDNVQKMITKAPKKTSAADTSPHARILIKYLDKDQEAPITKNNQLKAAKELGMLTVQRLFIIDSLSIQTTVKTSALIKPDAIEIMPGIMPKITKKLSEVIEVPVIVGGLISEKEDIEKALESGALGVSTSCRELW